MRSTLLRVPALAALVIGVQWGGSVPVAAAVPSAPQYEITAPAAVRADVRADFVLGASAALAPGAYCLHGTGIASTPVPVTSSSQTAVTIGATVSAAPGSAVTLSAWYAPSTAACPADPPGTALATITVPVTGSPARITLSPKSATAPAGTPTTLSWLLTDTEGRATVLTSGETVRATSNRSSVTFNGATDTTLTASGPGPMGAFTVQDSQIGAAVVTVTANGVPGEDPDATAALATTSVGSLTVSPVATTAFSGATTTFTVTARTGGVALAGQRVYVSVAGRNTDGSAYVATTGTSGTVTWSLRDTHPSSSTTQDVVTFTSPSLTSATATVTYLPTPVLTVTPTTASTAAGGTTSFTVTSRTAGGSPLTGVVVSATVSGRNPRTAATIGTTGTLGTLAWTWRDQNAYASTTQDVVTFTASGAAPVVATVSYQPAGTLTVPSSAVTATLGDRTRLWATFRNWAGAPVNGVPVTVTVLGRNTTAAASAGSTDAAGQVAFVLADNAPASSGVMTDTVVLAAAGATAQVVVTYLSPTATIVSPQDGGRISSGGLFGLTARTTGVRPGTAAYVTLDGLATATSLVQADGSVRFDASTAGGGRWLRAREGTYAVRVCGGPCGATQAVSRGIRLAVIPFGITSGSRVGDRLALAIATGAWSPGTLVDITRDGRCTAHVRIPSGATAMTALVGALHGRYQVRVSSWQGMVYGEAPFTF